MGREVWGLGGWFGLGRAGFRLRGVVLGLGVMGFGVWVLGLERDSLGFRHGVLCFEAR